MDQLAPIEAATHAQADMLTSGTPPDKLPHGIEKMVMSAVFGMDNPMRDDPVRWITEEAGEFVWSKQADVARSIVKYQYTAVPACHGVGKSWLMARLIAWWIDTHPLGEALVIFTAPTFRQVNTIIGKELRKVHLAAGLPGRVDKNAQWWIGDHLVAMGLKPDDHNSNAFQGQHAKYILVIVDEADGIHDNIWTGVDAVMTGPNSRCCAIGNPMNPSSQFATNCGANPIADAKMAWESIINISAFDSPAITGEEVPDELVAELVDQEWIDKRRVRWGEGSAPWAGRVLGEFPETADDKLISPQLIAEAVARELDGSEIGRFGLDVARFGSSETTLYRNRGGQIRLEVADFETSGPKVARMAAAAIEDSHAQAPVNVDADGVGGPVYDILHEDDQPVFPFHGGRPANEPLKYTNFRSECYWHLRQAFIDGLIDLDPKDTVLHAQLSNIMWKQVNGRIRVETKDEMRARGVPSPDRADGVMMSHSYLGDADYEYDRGGGAHMAVPGDGVGSITAGMMDEKF